jgi:hypothetical protein
MNANDNIERMHFDVNAAKLFFFVTDAATKKAGVFVPYKFLTDLSHSFE